jgi:hypothetical protein
MHGNSSGSNTTAGNFSSAGAEPGRSGHSPFNKAFPRGFITINLKIWYLKRKPHSSKRISAS